MPQRAKDFRERQAARVSTLSALLGVSDVTIRRDLEELERRGLLERTHGGAVSAQRMRIEPAFVDAVSSRPEEKRQIGLLASSLVEAGDTLYLNGGTTEEEWKFGPVGFVNGALLFPDALDYFMDEIARPRQRESREGMK